MNYIKYTIANRIDQLKQLRIKDEKAIRFGLELSIIKANECAQQPVLSNLIELVPGILPQAHTPKFQ
jgi:hypothetical protein